MVRAALALYQPIAEGSPAVLPFRPLGDLAARLDRADELLAAGDALLAALLARTVLEQCLRAILTAAGATPKDRGAGSLLGQCVTLGFVGPAARRLLALAVDVGNLAAHDPAGPDADDAGAMVAVVRWFLADRPVVAREGGAA